MKSERDGQYFGAKCWKEGKSVQETLESAARECGIENLPEDSLSWPKFVHGAEEAWQDKNIVNLDEQEKLILIKNKFSQKSIS
jgi:hypothetical protein